MRRLLVVVPIVTGFFAAGFSLVFWLLCKRTERATLDAFAHLTVDDLASL